MLDPLGVVVPIADPTDAADVANVTGISLKKAAACAVEERDLRQVDLHAFDGHAVGLASGEACDHGDLVGLVVVDLGNIRVQPVLSAEAR